MKKYRLRDDLAFDALVQIVTEFAPEEIEIVASDLDNCVVKKFEDMYLLTYYHRGHWFRSCLGVCIGVPYVSYELDFYDETVPSASVFKDFKRKVLDLALDYCIENRLVREVA